MKRLTGNTLFALLILSGNGLLFSQAAAQSAAYTYYADADSDGYGLTELSMVSAEPTPPEGYAALGGDCDDNSATVYPGARRSAATASTTTAMAW